MFLRGEGADCCGGVSFHSPFSNAGSLRGLTALVREACTLANASTLISAGRFLLENDTSVLVCFAILVYTTFV